MLWCSGAVSTNFSGRKAANPTNPLPKEFANVFRVSLSPTNGMQQPAHAFLFSDHTRRQAANHHGLAAVPRLFCNLGQSASPPMFWCSGAVSTNFSSRKAANPTNPLPEDSPTFFVVSRSPTNGMQQPAHALLFSGHTRRTCANHHGLGLCSSAILQFRSISVPANVLVFWCRFNELFRPASRKSSKPSTRGFADVFRRQPQPTPLAIATYFPSGSH